MVIQIVTLYNIEWIELIGGISRLPVYMKYGERNRVNVGSLEHNLKIVEGDTINKKKITENNLIMLIY